MNMYEDGDVEVPEYQRGFIWTKKQADKFIESILLGLPIPSIFLVKRNDKYDILDGQQRMTTMNIFYKNKIFPGKKQKFKFNSLIDEKWNKVFFNDLPENDIKVFERTRVPVVEILAEHTDDLALFQIFERINSGGTKLSPQNIRNAIWNGEKLKEINKLVNKFELANNLNFNNKEKAKQTDSELILRICLAYTIYKNSLSLNISKSNLNKICEYFYTKTKDIDNKNNFFKEGAEIFDDFFEIIKWIDGYLKINPNTFENFDNDKLEYKRLNMLFIESLITSSLLTNSFIKDSDLLELKKRIWNDKNKENSNWYNHTNNNNKIIARIQEIMDIINKSD